MNQKFSVLYILILLLHLGYIAYVLPINNEFSKSAVYNDDYSYHFYHAYLGKHFYLTTGRTWGFDPYFMAGYLKTPVCDPDVKFYEMFQILFRNFSSEAVFNLTILFILIINPILFILIGKLSSLSKIEILYCLILFIFYFWVSVPVGFVYVGMITFVFASILCILLMKGIINFFTTNKFIYYLALILPLIILLPIVHFISMPIIALIIFIIFVSFPKNLSLRNILFIFISLMFSLYINRSWLLLLLKYTSILIEPPQIFFQSLFPLRAISKENIIFGFIFPCPIFLLGLIYFIRNKFNLKKEEVIDFLFIFIFLLISLFGSLFGESATSLSPFRFIIISYFLMLIPAARQMSIIKLSTLNKRILSFIIVIVIFFQFFILSFLKLENKLPEYFKSIVQWISESTNDECRILIEDSSNISNLDKIQKKYFKDPILSRLPFMVRREFIGGPVPEMPIVHHFADFQYGKIFGKDINNFRIEKIKKYLQAYNICWIIAWSKKSKNYFNSNSSFFELKNTIEDFNIYKVNIEPNFIEGGTANVVSGYDMISLSNIRSKSNKIILKYHWFDEFISIPPVKIEKYPVLDDPVGFIQILNPPKNMVLRIKKKFNNIHYRNYK